MDSRGHDTRLQSLMSTVSEGLFDMEDYTGLSQWLHYLYHVPKLTWRTVAQWVTLLHYSSRVICFNPELRLLSVRSTCSPQVCKGYLWVLRFPLTSSYSMLCDELAFHPGCMSPCTQFSWNRLWVHHNPDQDKTVPLAFL